MIVSESNWKEAWETDWTMAPIVTMYIHPQLFQTDDRGISLIEKIGETHTEHITHGDGVNEGYLKIWIKQIIW